RRHTRARALPRLHRSWRRGRPQVPAERAHWDFPGRRGRRRAVRPGRRGVDAAAAAGAALRAGSPLRPAPLPHPGAPRRRLHQLTRHPSRRARRQVYTARGTVRRTAVATLVVLVACSDINPPPNHTPAYGYDLSGDVFHWPVSRLPVRFFGDTRGPMRTYVQRAIGLWEDQFLYGEFRGTLVADSSDADVIVTSADSVPADVPPDNGTPFDACSGFTTLIFHGPGTAL